ncbi:MAG: hypothetical protein PHI27_13760 [Eubacteriales bacterium]|nr:hypothetical protein [Eubacteriales bacterium]MDD3883289.1 hypothetical protein [Eubacteriales bacterium]MDD4513919.1 hypothetical protein [Eubacteriales bacterium]
MANKGFFESLLEDVAYYAAIQSSKDLSGKPDPYKAAGMLHGMRGDLSSADIFKMGGYLGAEGAFDSAPPSESEYSSSSAAPPSEAESTSTDWNSLSEEEKNSRVLKAERTKAQHSYWASLWNTSESSDRLPPLETASAVCLSSKKVSERAPKR